MFRVLLAATVLAISAPALACGDDANCDKAHCKMQSTEVVDTAMAAVAAAEGTQIAFTVEGMRCGACSDKITAAIKGIDGVNAAAVSHAEGIAKIAFDAEKTDADKLMAVIVEAGFQATKAES